MTNRPLPKTFALLGLGSVILLGLLYWRFSVPEASSPDQPTKTEIFADAFGRGDFERCYSLMSDDYRAAHSESYFVIQWEMNFANSSMQGLGEYEGITRVPTDARYTPVAGIARKPPNFVSHITYELRYSNGDFLLYLATRDGHADLPIERLYTSSGLLIPQRFIPTPTPPLNQDPIS